MPSDALSSRLRTATRAVHAMAERAGIMVPLLRGTLPRPAYRALLASLLPIYEALEAGLADTRTPPAVRALLLPGLSRVPALRADLADLAHLAQGHPAPAARGPTADALAYAAHLREIARREPILLAAHAYVRYLGDLSGGQVLARVVRAAYGESAPVSFYAFAEGPAMAKALRRALDEVAPDAAIQDRLVAEALAAFDRHVRLFGALEPALPGRPRQAAAT